MRIRGVLFTILLTLLRQSPVAYMPEAGFVPDSKTAIAVAEAVLIPVYSKKQIESEKPFNATLKDGIWTVGGTLRCPNGKGGLTTECEGGVAVVKISKKDGRILSMEHGQ